MLRKQEKEVAQLLRTLDPSHTRVVWVLTSAVQLEASCRQSFAQLLKTKVPLKFTEIDF